MERPSLVPTRFEEGDETITVLSLVYEPTLVNDWIRRQGSLKLDLIKADVATGGSHPPA